MQSSCIEPTTPALQVTDLDKRYARQALLRNISFTVAPGEFVALLGANGVGKTTLFKCLLDLSAIDAGTIEIFGMPHTDVRARTPVFYLPERFACSPFAKGRDLLHYLVSLHRQRPSEEAIHHLLTVLDFPIGSFNSRIGTLSKGSAQKLGLAATLLSNKPLLLLDEPMSGLDPLARILLKRELLQRKAQGLTMVFSTHLLADLNDLCDRLIILDKGRMQFCGTPQECLAQFHCDSLETAFLACIHTTPDVEMNERINRR